MPARPGAGRKPITLVNEEKRVRCAFLRCLRVMDIQKLGKKLMADAIKGDKDSQRFIRDVLLSIRQTPGQQAEEGRRKKAESTFTEEELDHLNSLKPS